MKCTGRDSRPRTDAVANSRLLRVLVFLEGVGVSCEAVIDSGATHTLVDASLVGRGSRRNPEAALQGVGGKAVPTYGRTLLEGRLQDAPFVASALIVDGVGADMILGLDWLEEEEASLDFKRRCLHHGRKARYTTHCSSLTPPTPVEIPELPTLTDDVPDDARRAIVRLMEDYGSLFAASGPRCGSAEHEVRLSDPTPFRVGPHRQSDTTKQMIREEVQQMLADGVVEPSRSPYSSPVVIVKKKDGKPRFCIDYRRLNAITIDEATHLPRIQETLKELGPATIFSSLDLKAGYWQVPLHPATKPLTAFNTPDGGCYQFTVMPFGLKGAPGTFQRLMSQEVLVGLIPRCCLVYLDDIIVYSGTWAEHIRDLRVVFERLQLHSLRISVTKCQIGRRSVDYLGHQVTAEGNIPQPVHLKGVEEAATPKTRRELREFLGLCNWLREYVPHFADIAAPLTDLLKTTMAFKWTPKANAAMQAVKAALRKPLKLARPDFTRRFTLQTDASGNGVAAVLYHSRPDGGRDIISYASARLSEAERRYHSNEQEALAAVWAIKKYRAYLEDRPFTLVTDNRALTWLHSAKDERAKLTRWAIMLSEHQFDIQHCAGKHNQLPDVLSRHPDATEPAINDHDDRMLVPSHQRPIALILELAGLHDAVKAAQRADPDTQQTLRALTAPDTIRPHPSNVIHNGVLCHRLESGQLLTVVPFHLRKEVVAAYHDDPLAGHPGAAETNRAIRRLYFWRARRNDVKAYVRACRICATRKRGAIQRPAHMTSHREATRPFEVLALDFMGPYPASRRQNKYILVIIDLFSRWVEAFPVRNSLVATILPLMEQEVFHRFGYPRALLTDNATQFSHAAWVASLSAWGCQHWTTPPYHPQANPTERRNQELKKAMRIQLEPGAHDRWCETLPRTLFALRCRQNAATGLTPSQAVLGYELPRPGEWRAQLQPPEVRTEALERDEQDALLLRHQEEYAERTNNRAATRPPPPHFTAGQRVYLRGFTRPGARTGIIPNLAPRWEGPYKVISRIGPNVYWVDRRGKPAKAHTNQIRPVPTPYAEPPGAEQTPPRQPEQEPTPPEDAAAGSTLQVQ